ncbi:MAG: class I SAM-dependent methyltransferase [Planctomycetes bacterium]|nr:class I SAM-dependent methyltransferase [Planctomycetota bacterium]MBU1518623.1 class I SAM-dependent methyltransferase [Planctomycetota bacterium]MBU2457711.1 class I SAM-dependent methyltransferase [Planctomycetota bacterium]
MKETKRHISREIGLEIGHIVGKGMFKLDHLHYGLWKKGLEPEILNLHIAQDEYCKFIIAHIPAEVKSILDVGCGAGAFSKRLVDLGYNVDCVCPTEYQNKLVEQLLGGTSEVFKCKLEDIRTDKKYDMVQFCESFQYIDLDRVLDIAGSLIKQGGYMLICDFFKIQSADKCGIKGGHKFDKFMDLLGKSPFEVIENIDITEQTAPNMDILDRATKEVMIPVVSAAERFVRSRHPFVLKLIKWRYRKKIEKAEKKYLQGKRAGKDFAESKTYRLFVCRKTK